MSILTPAPSPMDIAAAMDDEELRREDWLARYSALCAPETTTERDLRCALTIEMRRRELRPGKGSEWGFEPR